LPNQVIGLGQKLTVRVLKVHGDTRKLDLSLRTAFRIRLRIPQGDIGTLIGRKGSTVNGIKAETDTEIRLSSEGVVTIWGARQSKVDAAQARIRALSPEAEAIIEDG
jgi:polyribonucleotide nucleotidyltransferase